MPWFAPELPEEDISNVVVRCRWYLFYSKLPWFVFELHENDISNVGSSVGLKVAFTSKSAPYLKIMHNSTFALILFVN